MHGPPTCPACGQQSWSIVFEGTRDRLYDVPGEFTLWRCGECDVQRIWPPPDDMAPFYPSDYYSYASAKAPDEGMVRALARAVRRAQRQVAWRAHRAGVGLPRRMTDHPRAHSQAFQELTEYAPRDVSSVLDVGCGAGDFLADARKLGLRVRGVEMSESAAAAVRDRGLECEAGGVDSLYGIDDCYDLIRLSDVLEHLLDPLEALRAVAQSLAPNGVALIRVPNVEGAMARLCGEHWFQLDAPRHLWGFGAKSLALLLGEAGLETDRIETHSEVRVLYYSLRNLLQSKTELEMPWEPKRDVLNTCIHMGWTLDAAGLGESLLAVAKRG